MSALSPDQFFHGTTHNIQDGMVRPANDANKGVSEYSFGDPGDMSEGDHAFAIRDNESYAWQAAHTFHKNGRRPRVYEVDPAPDMDPGPWNKEHPDYLEHLDEHGIDTLDDEDVENSHQDEWASKTGFPVRKRIDIMPGRQGTFPSENWNKFKKDSPRVGYDANHPDHNQVAQGMNYQEKEDLRRNAVSEEPKRRSGASLRAFMEGKPEPTPTPRREATLF